MHGFLKVWYDFERENSTAVIKNIGIKSFSPSTYFGHFSAEFESDKENIAN